MPATFTPAPLLEMLSRLAGQQRLPTALNTRDLRDQIARDIRATSVYSARTTSDSYLEDIRSAVTKMVDGTWNEATARQHLQTQSALLGYDPAAGFPGDTAQGIPPADEGSLRDLGSDRRVKLLLETRTRQALNFGAKLAGNEPEARYLFPAWELIRLYDRDVPRDVEKGGLSWAVRFVMAGGSLVDGRLIALKDDEVWSNLGDSELFDDGLDSEMPPYWFNSGAGWRAVPREECLELGLITGEESPESIDPEFAADVRADADRNTLSDLTATRDALREAAARLRAGD